MKARIVIALAVGALFYGWACDPAPNNVPIAAPSVVPSLTPLAGRTFTYSQPSGTLAFHVDSVAGDTATYSLTQGGKTTPGLTAKLTNGVYWVLQGANPVTKDITTYPTDTTVTAVATFPTNRVDADASRRYWFYQGIIVKATENNVDTTLSTVTTNP